MPAVGSPTRQDWRDALGVGHLVEDTSSTVDGCHGSDDLQRLDLRSSEAARSSSEGSASADAAGDRRIQEEERSDRCRQARGLPTLRLPAGVLHGIDGDSREEANAAVSPSPGTASGAAEESCIKLADGNRSELQQTAPAPSRVFPRAAGQQGAIDKSIRPLLRLSRDSITRLQRIESALIRSLQRDPLLAERVRRLQTIPCVGRITALTWALEMGGYFAFPIDPTSHQLLRALRRRKEVRRDRGTHTAFQAAE